MTSQAPDDQHRDGADERPAAAVLPGLLTLLMHATERRAAGRPVPSTTEEPRPC